MHEIKLLLKVFYFLNMVAILNKADAQDAIDVKTRNIFIAVSGSYTASKNFDLARHYVTRSVGAEIGYFITPKTVISISYEKTKIDEYSAKFKNQSFINLNLKRLIPLSDKFQSLVSLSGGKASGKYINFGFNAQGESEIDVNSTHGFLELGARYTPNNYIFIEFRFLQFGYINKSIDKAFQSNIKDFVFNDDEYFPLRLSVGYRI